MARILPLFLLCTLGVSLAFAQGQKKQTTIYGEVIDVVNYMANGMKPDNPDRKALAESSAKAGYPLGILEKGTGKIYLVAMQQRDISAVQTLVPYFGLKIFAVGQVYKKGGLQLFLLSDIGKSVK
jgi:hypothetical protein